MGFEPTPHAGSNHVKSAVSRSSIRANLDGCIFDALKSGMIFSGFELKFVPWKKQKTTRGKQPQIWGSNVSLSRRLGHPPRILSDLAFLTRYLMLGLTKHGPRRADAGTPSGSLLCVCAGVIARRDGCQTGVGIPPCRFRGDTRRSF